MKYLSLVLLLSGCYLSPVGGDPTRPSITLASQTPPLTTSTSAATTSLPAGLYDALPAMQGICFEAAWDAAGQSFIMRNAEEHIHFYDLVDNSRLCRQPSERLPFDFSTGDVLAGLWTRGSGCTAAYTIHAYQRDDSAKTIQILASFSTEGACPYELVRGFWLGFVAASDYEIRIDVIQ